VEVDTGKLVSGYKGMQICLYVDKEYNERRERRWHSVMLQKLATPAFIHQNEPL